MTDISYIWIDKVNGLLSTISAIFPWSRTASKNKTYQADETYHKLFISIHNSIIII